MRTCTMPGCDNKHRARGLCATHYNQQHQPNRHVRVERVCETCSATYLTLRPDGRFCSLLCRDVRRKEETRKRHALKPKVIKALKAIKAPKAPYVAPDMRSPLRIAYESADHAGVIAAIKACVDVRPSGCWEWQRSLNDKGYATVIIHKRNFAVHRLALEAKCEAPLGKQAAHHICANTVCVNPDHLQPVTARENIAEMLARTYLTSRIRDLEAALTIYAPRHPLLLEVGVMSSAA